MNERLSKNIVPHSYRLHIDVNMVYYTFDGDVNIRIEIKKHTQQIVLHSKDLVIKNINIMSHDLKTYNYLVYNEGGLLTIEISNGQFEPGFYVIGIAYHGIIDDTMEGIYKSKYVVNNEGSKYLIATQLESQSARKVFPCFDEPNFKAIFELSLSIPINKTALSNMPIENIINNQNCKTIRFVKTPIMSTYVFAFVIGDFGYIESITKHNTIVRVYSTPNKQDKLRFALDVSIRALEWFNDWFKIRYSLPKLDFIAIPNFTAGAMENWGLITFREQNLLYDQTTSIQDRQNIVNTICHEIAHQWIGNLVTIEWWTYLWLNESIATYLAWLATDCLFPDWNIWKRFNDEEHSYALELDSLTNTHPLEVQNLNLSDINEIFDSISYSKGACLIKCLANYIGLDNFKNGIHNYLVKYQYGNTVSSDFWKEFGNDIYIMMYKWTTTPGYPLVTVEKKYSNNNIIFTQTKYMYCINNRQTAHQLWYIPIDIYIKDNQNKESFLLDKDRAIYFCKDNLDSVIINHNRNGFYRIKHDIPPLPDSLTIDDITHLIIDMTCLTFSGHINFIDVIEYIKKIPLYEDKYNDYYFWKSLMSYIEILFKYLANEYKPQKKYYKMVMIPILNVLYYKYIKITNIVNKDDGTIMFMNLCIKYLGLYGNFKIMSYAFKCFRNNSWNNNYEILSIVGKYGNNEDYNQIIEMIDITNGGYGNNKEPYLEAISRTIKPDLIKKNLSLLLSDKIRSQDLCFFIKCMSENILITDELWNTVIYNWEYFLKKFPEESSGLQELVKSLGTGFMTENQLNKYKTYFKVKPSGTNMVIDQTIEKIAYRIDIITKLYNELSENYIR